MRIVAPLSSFDEVEELIEAGADEFFCGVDAGSATTMNRRELPRANIRSLNELKRVKAVCERADVPIAVTLNKVYYVDGELEEALGLVGKLIDVKIDSILVADIGLLRLLFDRGFHKSIHIHLSSVAATFNSAAIAHFRNYPISRIVLPRHLSIRELRTLRERQPDIEMETFVLNWNCMNIDGLCNTQHDLTRADGKLPAALLSNQCCLPYDISLLGRNGHGNNDLFLRAVRRRFTCVQQKSSRACGACYLPELQSMGIGFAKVLDRLLGRAEKVRSVGFVKDSLRLAQEIPDRAAHAEAVRRLYRETFNLPCARNCYFRSK